MKEFTAFMALAIAFVILTNYAVEAWDRSYWSNLTVVEQINNIIVIDLDESLTEGTDMANELAGQAILNVCEDGYSVIVRNWSAVAPYEVIDLAMARELADPSLLVLDEAWMARMAD